MKNDQIVCNHFPADSSMARDGELCADCERRQQLTIQNPNTSGQGYSEHHKVGEYHNVISVFGYKYSHSTPVRHANGDSAILHTYKQGEHNVSTWSDNRVWETSTSCASGRMWSGIGQAELRKHLSGKRKRYISLKARS